MKNRIMLSISVMFFYCFSGLVTLNAHNINLYSAGTHNFQDTLIQKSITSATDTKINLKDWENIFDTVKVIYPTLSYAKGIYIPKQGNAIPFELGRIRYTTKNFSKNPQVGDVLMIYDIIILDSNKQKVKIKKSLSFTAK
jgi:hypothetical protein